MANLVEAADERLQEPLYAACAGELAAAWARKDAAFAAAIADPSNARKRAAYQRSLAGLQATLAVLGDMVRNHGRSERALLSHSIATNEAEFVRFRAAVRQYWQTVESARGGEASEAAVDAASGHFVHANAVMQREVARRRAAVEAAPSDGDPEGLRLGDAEHEILRDWEGAAAACHAHFAAASGNA
jgi:hypothetical protein